MKLAYFYLVFIIVLSAKDLPKKPFYCVRHGTTAWNLLGKQHGQANIPLHNQGRTEATKLRAITDILPITQFWSSPLSRAAETMTILNKNRQLPIFIAEDLKERGKGNLEGLTTEEWNALAPETIAAQMENAQEFKERTERVLHTILSYDGVPCIVTHANSIRCIARLLGRTINIIPTCGIWYCTPDADGVWHVIQLKDAPE